MLYTYWNDILINLKMIMIFEQEDFEKDEILKRM